jgi:hypothetical protein
MLIPAAAPTAKRPHVPTSIVIILVPDSSMSSLHVKKHEERVHQGVQGVNT